MFAKCKNALIAALLCLPLAAFIGTPLATSADEQLYISGVTKPASTAADMKIDMSSSFLTTGNPVTNGELQHISVTSDEVSIGDYTKPYYGTFQYQVGAVTSKFSIDWTRSFVLKGQMATPVANDVAGAADVNIQKSADQSMIGFHTDEGRVAKQSGTAAGYGDAYSSGNRTSTSPGLANSVSWYLNHWKNTTNHLGTGSYALTNDIGWVYWNSSGVPRWWDVSGDAPSGIKADETTTWASSTLTGGQDNKISMDGNPHDFEISWTVTSGATDSTNTIGALTFSYNGYTKTVNGISVADLFGSEDKAKSTYFEMSTSLYRMDVADSAKQVSAQVDKFAYTDIDLSDSTIEYSVERDGKTVVYNQNDCSTWPQAGEVVHVKFNLINKNNQQNDITNLPFRISLSGLVDGANVSTHDTSYFSNLKVNGVAVASEDSDIFNEVTDGTYKTATLTFDSTHKATVEYDIQAGATASLIADDVLSDSIVVGTQGMQQETITGQCSAVISSKATCRIAKTVDGETVNYYYATLDDAINDAEAGNTIEIFRDTTLEKTVSADKQLTIKNAETQLVEGEELDKEAKTVFAADAQLKIQSNVSLNGVIFDGASESRNLPGVSVESGLNSLVISGNSQTTNSIFQNFTNGAISNSGNLQLEDGCEIKDNCVFGVLVNSDSISTTVTGTVKVTGNKVSASSEDECNIHLAEGKMLGVKADLSEDAKIGVTADGTDDATGKVRNTKGAVFAARADFSGLSVEPAKDLKNLDRITNDLRPWLYAVAVDNSENATDENIMWTDDPVCKIITTSGEAKCYTSLASAISDANSGGSDFIVNGSIKIEMLVGEYEVTADDSSYEITTSVPVIITTASEGDAQYPYRGKSGTNATIKRHVDGDSLFKVSSGSLTFEKLNIDGDGDNYSSNVDGSGSVATVASGANLTLSDVSIKNNKNSASNGAGAICVNDGTLVLDGRVVVDENVDSTGKACNVYSDASLNETKNIQVKSLTDGSKVGIYEVNSYTAGSQFANSGSVEASTVSGLEYLINDRDASLYADTAAGSAIQWFEVKDLTVTATLPEATDHDVWVVFQVVDNNSAVTYRQAVKVATGNTTNSQKIKVKSSHEFTVSVATNMSNWCYEVDTTSYDKPALEFTANMKLVAHKGVTASKTFIL